MNRCILEVIYLEITYMREKNKFKNPNLQLQVYEVDLIKTINVFASSTTTIANLLVYLENLYGSKGRL